MALTATIYHLEIALSDVDRGVYETLDLRLARHPSETLRFMLTRAFAYALSYEDGIAFSKGGISSTDEPPVSVKDPTGLLMAWIDVGTPAADRLHKATKAASRVALYTTSDLAPLRREITGRPVHKVETIEVWRLDTPLMDALEKVVDRHTKLEVVRTDGQLYVTVGGKVLEGAVRREFLAPEP